MNLPNKITVSRLILIPFFVLVYYLGFHGHYFVATAIFAIASITDFLDGHIARKRNLVTDLGKFLDPIADKVLVLVALTIMLSDTDIDVFLMNQLIGAIGVSIIITRELAVSSLRMLAAKNGKVLAADKMGKIKTFLTDVAIIVLIAVGDLYWINSAFANAIHIVGVVLFVISVIITILSGVSYLVKNKEVFAE